jgi:hypothetical protein
MATVEDWEEIFRPARPQESSQSESGGPGECNVNCQTARCPKCICRCGGRNHGARLRENVERLDEFNQPDVGNRDG